MDPNFDANSVFYGLPFATWFLIALLLYIFLIIMIICIRECIYNQAMCPCFPGGMHYINATLCKNCNSCDRCDVCNHVKRSDFVFCCRRRHNVNGNICGCGSCPSCKCQCFCPSCEDIYCCCCTFSCPSRHTQNNNDCDFEYV